MGGEDVLFWTDLSSAKLINGSFQDSSDQPIECNPDYEACDFSQWMPPARTEHGGFVMAFDSLQYDVGCCIPNYDGLVYTIAKVGVFYRQGEYFNEPALATTEAYAIDGKIDDGLPLTGLVVSSSPGRIGDTGLPGFNSEWASGHGDTTDFCVSN